MTILSIITTIWNGLPAGLRSILAWGVGIGLAIGVVMLTYFIWQTGTIQQKLDLLPTKADMVLQTDTLQTVNAQVIDSLMDDAIFRYDLLMRQYLANERKQAVDTAFVPLLRQVKVLTDVLVQMQNSARQTDARVKELPAQFDAKLDRMLQANMPAQSMEDMMTDMMRREQRRDSLLRAIQEQLPQRKPSKPGKF